MSLSLDKSSWKRFAFGDAIESITDRVDNPSEAGVDRYVGLEHLDPGVMTVQRWDSPDKVEAQKLRFLSGDVIFGRRCAYQKKVAKAEFEGICSAHALVLRARPDYVDPDFLPVFLSSDYFLERAIEISVGSLSPTVNWRDLKVQEFDLPSLDEQKRIAHLVWALENDSRSRAQEASALRQLRAAHLQERMASIAATSGTVELDALIEPGRPITYGILMPGSGHPGGVPVVKVKDFPAGYIQEAELLLTSPELAHEYRRSTLKAGDLLISIRGTVGRLAEVPASLDGANITQDTARLSIAPEHDRQYVRLVLESNFVATQIRRQTTGLAVKGLNLGALRKLQMPIPSAGESERALVRESTQIDEAIKRVEVTLTACRALGASLLAEIFGGD
jgi:hypothetical protein